MASFVRRGMGAKGASCRRPLRTEAWSTRAGAGASSPCSRAALRSLSTLLEACPVSLTQWILLEAHSPSTTGLA